MSRVIHLLVLAFLMIAIYFAVSVPFAAVTGAAYAAWLTDHDIYYYFSMKPPAFWRAFAVGALSLIAVLLLWAWIYVRTLFALPACVLARLGPLESLKTSWHLTKGTVLRKARILIIWLLIMIVLGIVFSLALNAVEYISISLAGERLAILVPALAVLVILNILAAAVFSFIFLTTNSLLVVQLYNVDIKDYPELHPALHDEPVPSGEKVHRISKLRLVLAIVALFLVTTGVVTYLIIEQIGIKDSTAITAHRGSSRIAPENSLSAIKAAIRQGADFAEIDVQRTADGTIVLLHDTDLKRVAGVSKNIWEVPYDEIKSLDAGSWFSEEFRDERIPTLQQVIDEARGEIKLNIELKFNGHDDKLVESVVDLIRKNDFHTQCIVSSLSYDGVVEAKRLNENLSAGHIVAVSIGNVSKLDVDFMSIQHKNITPSMIRSLHRSGKEIHAWTVNNPSRMSELIDLGVDNILTDEPDTMHTVLDERSHFTKAERLLLGVRPWLTGSGLNF
jgi:glycerophosphoryl diester phosphodiesterase